MLTAPSITTEIPGRLLLFSTFRIRKNKSGPYFLLSPLGPDLDRKISRVANF